MRSSRPAQLRQIAASEGTWQEVIWQLIENDASKTGVMIHLVTPELDKGPPITFYTYLIREESFD